jgi:hypothetical protein
MLSIVRADRTHYKLAASEGANYYYYYYYYKLERVQRKFAALCHKRFFQDMEYHYDIILEKLNLLTLHIRRHHIDALFLINAFYGTKNCPSVLETVGLRIPTRNIRNFTTFSCPFSHCLSARCVSAANAVCKSIDIFRKPCWSLSSLSLFIIFVF